MTSSTENEQASGLRSEARQNRLIVVLADISGYADLMVRNQTAAMHGQIMVTMRIEAMLKQVEIPLRLQEMEGDADFSAFSLCIWDLRSYVQGHSGH
jgi:hypothetical protein